MIYISSKVTTKYLINGYKCYILNIFICYFTHSFLNIYLNNLKYIKIMETLAMEILSIVNMTNFYSLKDFFN